MGLWELPGSSLNFDKEKRKKKHLSIKNNNSPVYPSLSAKKQIFHPLFYTSKPLSTLLLQCKIIIHDQVSSGTHDHPLVREHYDQLGLGSF